MSFKGIEEKNLHFFCKMLMRSKSPIVITDAIAPDNPIIFVNPAFEELTGYTSDEAVGRNCRFLQGNDHQQPARYGIAAAIKNGGPSECTIRNYRKNGDLFWNRLYLFPVEDSHGRITNFVGIQHDVTAEKELVSVLEEKQRVIDTSLDVYLKVGVDAAILEANGACTQVFGWDPDELVGKSITCLVSKERAHIVERDVTSLLAQTGPQKNSAQYQRKDGTAVFMEWTVSQSTTRDALLATGRDVTERRQLEYKAVKASEQMNAILDSITEGCFSVDKEWCCTYINKKGAELLFGRPEDIVGKNIWDKFSDAVGSEFYKTYHLVMQTQQYGQCEHFYLGKWLEARAYPSEAGLTVFFLDITERKKHEEALLYSATHDSLTGLLNRNSCIASLERLLSTESAQRLPLGVFFIDLDHFKEINDAFGHRAGDTVLMEIGNRLQALSNAGCIFYRISGDEFVCVSQNSSKAVARDVADQILRSISLPVQLCGSEVTVGASIGIAVTGDRAISADDLINQADTAMYAAKSKGRHAIAFFSPEVSAWGSQRHRLRQEMLQALHQRQFVLHYQPQVSLSDGKLVGAEALIRWQHPELGLLAPIAFIDIAEDSPLIIALGEWVFEEACRQLAIWQRSEYSLKMSINVSARQLADRNLPMMMEKAAVGHGVAPHCLKLEVTESMLAQDFEVASKILGVLKQKGFRIALDDFGTGYSNLSYINRLPITAIKIDRSFVKEIDIDDGALALINAIVALAKSLGMSVICEGIETEAQLKVLKATKCDSIQGYLISKPLSANDFSQQFLRAI